MEWLETVLAVAIIWGMIDIGANVRQMTRLLEQRRDIDLQPIINRLESIESALDKTDYSE